MTILRHSFFGLLLVLNLVLATGAYADDYVQAISSKGVGINGSPYDSIKQKFLGVQCVNVATVPAGPTDSSFELTEQLDERQAADELGMSVGGRARFGVVEASASANFLTASVSDSFSVSAIYSARYLFPSQKTTEIHRNDIGETAKDSYESWEKTCGDRYVDETVRGAKLFVSVRIEFASEQQKKEFMAKFSVQGPLAGVEGELNQASKTFGRNVKISVTAYQFGGDVSKITAIFPDASALGDYTSCTLGTFESCAKVIQGILHYATDVQTGFPSQLGPGASPGPSVISYGLAEYPRSIVTGVPPELKDAVRLSRNLLSDKFEVTFGQYVTAERLLRAKLPPERRSEVSATFESIKQNLIRLLTASNVCYEKPTQCPTAVNRDLVLIAIAEDALLPTTFKAACIAAIKLQPDDPMRITVQRLVKLVNPSGFTSTSDIQDCDTDSRLLAKFTTISLERLKTDEQPPITDLSPLGGLTSLESLNITGNQVSELSDLSSLGELRSLDASNNRITNLEPLEALTELNLVVLSNNRLTDISPLARVPKLVQVVLNGNEIQDVSPLTNLLDLFVINLNSNNVSTLAPFKRVYRLDNMQIYNNLLTEEEVNKFKATFPSVSVMWRGNP